MSCWLIRELELLFVALLKVMKTQYIFPYAENVIRNIFVKRGWFIIFYIDLLQTFSTFQFSGPGHKNNKRRRTKFFHQLLFCCCSKNMKSIKNTAPNKVDFNLTSNTVWKTGQNVSLFKKFFDQLKISFLAVSGENEQLFFQKFFSEENFPQNFF